MNLANIPLTARVSAGAVAALALLGGGIAAGAHFGGSTSAASLAPIVASPAPTSSTGATTANGAAAQAARRALLQGEAQVLGISLKQLGADLKARQTIQQLATAKGLSEEQFGAQLVPSVQPLLDQQVKAGALTQAQEQRQLKRLGTTVPNWTQVAGAPKQASPSPSATP